MLWVWGEAEHHGSGSKWQRLLTSQQPGSREIKTVGPEKRFIFLGHPPSDLPLPVGPTS
jgi:hypothetical protein